jgi:phage tail-like protein
MSVAKAETKAEPKPWDHSGGTAMEVDYPLPAFAFSVDIDGCTAEGEASFQDVSGIGMEMETEPLIEGGVNGYVHQLPKSPRPGRLTLKRGGIARTSSLFDWCHDFLSGDLVPAKIIHPRTVRIHLRDEKGNNVCSWTFTNAYPVKWEVEALNATKNEVAVEQIELVFQSVKREA